MVNILITGIGGGGVGEQLIKALRLSENNYFLIGTDITGISKGFKEVDKAFIVPRANDVNYINELINICISENIKAIFPGSELELLPIARSKKQFEELGINVFINNNTLLDICLDKTKTINFLKENNFNFPQSFTIKKIQDIGEIEIFPIVLKPSIGGGGSMNVMIAQSKEELELFSRFLLNIYDEFVAQEYVGTPEHEYTVGVLYDLEGEYINSIALKRSLNGGLNVRLRIPNKSGNESFGKQLVISSGISQGEFGPYDIVLEQCKKIAEKLNPTSAINLQCRLVNNKVYLFEVNPRFSGTTSLRAMVGYNEPDVLIKRHILKQEVEVDFKYNYAKIVRGLKEEIFEN